jgi:hypothetical protein
VIGSLPPILRDLARGWESGANASKFALVRKEKSTAQNIEFMRLVTTARLQSCPFTKQIENSDQGDLDAFALGERAFKALAAHITLGVCLPVRR